MEVLDEAEAAAAVELRAAAKAAAAAAAAPLAAAFAKPAADDGSCADSAKSLLVEAPPAPAPTLAVEDEGAAAAAAEAAAIGIRFVANHHRTLSMETVSTTSSAADAALAAVHGSSATTGDAVAAARALQQPAPAAGGSTHSSIRSVPMDGQSEGVLASEPSFAGLLRTGESPAGRPSPGAPAAGGSSAPESPGLPRPRRLTDELDAVSDVPSFSEGSGPLGSPLTGSGDSPLGLSGLSSPCSVSFELPSPRQQGAAPAGTADQQLQQRLTALNLPARGKQPGAGTWIGGSVSPPPASQRQTQQQQAQAQQLDSIAASTRSGSGGGAGSGVGQLQGDVASSLDRALAGLRGEAPLVSVRLEVLNDRPLSSARSSGSAAADQQQGTPRSVDSAGSGSAASAAAGRRRASLDAARRSPHQCDSSSWACKLGLCKLCNAKLATMGDDEDEPFVRVHFTVQGGVGELGVLGVMP